uniref:Uncharacterized protein n=1 Tax=Steinernema glaseri TaxID=37863 RepID=A0A1I7XXA5_9BILA
MRRLFVQSETRSETNLSTTLPCEAQEPEGAFRGGDVFAPPPRPKNADRLHLGFVGRSGPLECLGAK